MKYTKQIVILMTVNLIIAFLLIYIGHQARQVEILNSDLKTSISKLKQDIIISKIEFTFHNNSEYLKKLYELYIKDIDKNHENIILSFNDFSSKGKTNILLVDY
tara:strand:+ start:373 stop:684 length:312 start_codon:yes stop_codon:yes gene_type:complete